MLYELIKQHAAAAAAAADWSTVAATLNAATVPVVNSTLRTTRWIMKEFTAIVDGATGATEADLILGTLQAGTLPRLVAAYDAMSAGGLDLSDPQSQQMIDVVGAAAGWPQSVIDKLKESGIRMVSPAEHEGLPTVTAAAAESAWEAGELAAEFAAQMNDVVWPSVSAGRAALVAALQSAAANLGA